MKGEIPEIEENLPADAWSTLEGRKLNNADWLAEATRKFLAEGGEITKVPEGASGYEGGLLS